MSKKMVVALSLTTEHDQWLDDLAADHVEFVGNTLRGEPNRSAFVKAMIQMFRQDRDLLRAFLIRNARQQAA
jgi:hypothetical protein